MTFNYAVEKRKFEKVWEKLAKSYAEAGMEPEAIKAMREFDWEIFKSERNEALHTQEFAIPESTDEDTGDCESPLYDKFLEQLSSEYDTYGSHSRYWWLEELTTPCLTIGVPALTVEDKELLTSAFLFLSRKLQSDAILRGSGSDLRRMIPPPIYSI